MEERKIKEMEFHNAREVDRGQMSEEEFLEKYSNKRFYAITDKGRQYLTDFLTEHADGKVALDYCCGLGHGSLRLAEIGAQVYGIDISDESVATAAKLLEKNGYGETSHFHVMDAENTTFEDDFFDVIVCSGVLHHLDVAKAFPELSRILKKDGKIICLEALGYNPIITWYRRRTPHLRTEWEADHILTMKELKVARKNFDDIDVKYFYLFAIPAALFQGTFLFKPVLAIGSFLDSIFLRIPLVRLLAWQMIFILSRPRD